MCDRAAAYARYAAAVEQLYPHSQFGGEQGGLSKEIEEAAKQSFKRARNGDHESNFVMKNANVDNAASTNPATAFDNVRPTTVVEDSSAGRVVDADLQVTGAIGNFSDYRVRLHGELEDGSFGPKYMCAMLRKNHIRNVYKGEPRKA